VVDVDELVLVLVDEVVGVVESRWSCAMIDTPPPARPLPPLQADSAPTDTVAARSAAASRGVRPDDRRRGPTPPL